MKTDTTLLLPREDLMVLLDSHVDKRLIHICAAAGFGKTVCAQQWIEHRNAKQNVKHAWIKLDDYDDRIAGFCKRLSSALLDLQPLNTKLRDIAEHPNFNTAPDEFTAQALTAFRNDEQKYVIIIDDLHVIKSVETLRMLPVICSRLPESFSLLCLSRSEPPDIFADMILKNDIAVISMDNLLFTLEETVMLFEKNMLSITNKQAYDIFNATGGWALGIHTLLVAGEESYEKRLTSRYLETFLKNHIWRVGMSKQRNT